MVAVAAIMQVVGWLLIVGALIQAAGMVVAAIAGLALIFAGRRVLA